MSDVAVVSPHLQTVSRIGEIRPAVKEAQLRGKHVGLVPTMGALHAGHLSLVEAARRECDYVVVTIFVNPLQFGPHEDFESYPRCLETDLEACRQAGVDVVFHPAQADIFPPSMSTYVEVADLTQVLEGVCRPTHFRGVTTIVMKLFQIAPADTAYFGQKDYQQQLVIRRMCRDLNVPIEIVTCPTVREADGLAISSRNCHLDVDQRCRAALISQALRTGVERLEQGTPPESVRERMLELLSEEPDVAVDYATVADPETLEPADSLQSRLVLLVAARIGGTRLIDNMLFERNP